MSEDELRNTIIARVTESNAWERHKMRMHPNDDPKVSTISEEGGFSEIEKHAGKRHEEMPAITYDSNTKKFAVSCNCGKEKFVFDIKKDTVESEGEQIKMKEIDPYKKDNQKDGYGREQSEESSTYNNGPVKQGNNSYSPQPSRMRYQN